ncbi:MAG: hypothetical protein WC211_07320, partial [Dehalococcoidia bacterium]
MPLSAKARAPPRRRRAGEGRVSKQVVTPRIRGFIATNAHPDGCAQNVQNLWAHARTTSTGGKLDNV